MNLCQSWPIGCVTKNRFMTHEQINAWHYNQVWCSYFQVGPRLCPGVLQLLPPLRLAHAVTLPRPDRQASGAPIRQTITRTANDPSLTNMELDIVTFMPCEVTHYVLVIWGSERKESSNRSTLDSLLNFKRNMRVLPLGFVLHLMRPWSGQVPDRAVTLCERIALPSLTYRLGAKIDGLQLTIARLWSGAQHEKGPRFACQVRIRKHSVNTCNLAYN